jgi:ribulose kinase
MSALAGPVSVGAAAEEDAELEGLPPGLVAGAIGVVDAWAGVVGVGPGPGVVHAPSASSSAGIPANTR